MYILTSQRKSKTAEFKKNWCMIVQVYINSESNSIYQN